MNEGNKIQDYVLTYLQTKTKPIRLLKICDDLVLGADEVFEALEQLRLRNKIIRHTYRWQQPDYQFVTKELLGIGEGYMDSLSGSPLEMLLKGSDEDACEIVHKYYDKRFASMFREKGISKDLIREFYVFKNILLVGQKPMTTKQIASKKFKRPESRLRREEIRGTRRDLRLLVHFGLLRSKHKNKSDRRIVYELRR